MQNIIEITHNPYTIQTKIKENGQITNIPSVDELVSNQRMQRWASEKLIKLIFEYVNTFNLKLIFNGVELDCDDFQQVVDDFLSKNPDYKINLTTNKLGEPDIRLRELKELFEIAKAGPIEDFQKDDFVKTFKTAVDPRFTVSVLAPMKAGKSTFINAMIGKNLLPENITACTATITRIEDVDSQTEFQGCAYADEGILAPDGKPRVIDAEVLKKWNRDTIKEVVISGDIPSISSSNTRLVLVDTPGPNNSQNENHKIATFNFFETSEKSLVLYLLNIGAYGTEDDSTYFHYVANQIINAGRQASDRFLFIVTKADGVDHDKNDFSKILNEEIKMYLSGKKIKNAKLIPVSAKFAKLARMKYQKEHLTQDELEEYDLQVKRYSRDHRKQLHQYAMCSPYVNKMIQDKIDKGDETEKMECYTGLAVVEATIQEYITKYAIPAKIYDAINDIKACIEKHKIKSLLINSVKNNEIERKKLSTQLKQANTRINNGDMAKKFRKKIKTLEWNPPDKINELTEQCKQDFMGIVNDAFYKIENEITEKKSGDIIRIIQSKMDELLFNFRGDLAKNLKNVVEKRFNELTPDYKTYVIELLGAKEVNTTVADFVMPQCPDLKKLQNNATESKSYIEKKQVKLKGWDYLNPAAIIRRWFPDEVERTVKHVKTKKFKEDVLEEGIKTIRSATEIAQEVTKTSFEMMKQEFLKEMDRLDEVIKQTIEELQHCVDTRKSVDDNIEKLNISKEWLENFELRLNALISLEA